MFRRQSISGFILSALFLQSCAMGPHDSDASDPLHVELSVRIVQSDYRQYPVFHVLAENRSDSAVRIIDLRDRPDLQHAYCPVYVKPVDRSFEFLVAISDPDYLGEDGMIFLSPGDEARLELSRQPIDYRQFVPREYEAVRTCRIDADRIQRIYRPAAVIFRLDRWS